MMKPDLYTEVALTRDIPTEKLKQGDVAVVIDYVPQPDNGEEGAIIVYFRQTTRPPTMVSTASIALISSADTLK
jgi:hypothetical protein